MENFYLYVLMCIFLIILPGPDTAITTKNTVTVGRTGGFKTVFGTCCALLIHTAAAVLGLSAIIMKSAMLFSILKYVGAAYLLYLGIKTLWALKYKKDMVSIADQENKFADSSCFKQGFLTNILNPKVAVFFLTFLPQFVNTESNTLLSFLMLGMTYTVLTAIWSFLYVYLINQISVFMKKPKTQSMIEGLTGTILIGFGIKLFFEKAHH